MDKRLEAFLAVARYKTTVAAAARINIVQSSITKRIANLEQELGTTLFVRDRHGMKLTQAGGMFFERAVRIEREYRNGLEEVASIAAAGMDELKIGAGPVFHLNWAADLFCDLKRNFPELKIDLRTQGQEDVAEALKNGALDVYLGMIPKEQLDDTLFVKHLIEVEHGIVIRKGDPVAQISPVDPASLAGYHWVSFVVDPVTESSISQYTLPANSSKSLIDIRTSSFATGLQLVKSGGFVMSAPLQLANVVEKEGLAVLPVRHGMPRRDAGLHVRKSSLGHGAIQATIDHFARLLGQAERV